MKMREGNMAAECLHHEFEIVGRFSGRSSYMDKCLNPQTARTTPHKGRFSWILRLGGGSLLSLLIRGQWRIEFEQHS